MQKFIVSFFYLSYGFIAMSADSVVEDEGGVLSKVSTVQEVSPEPIFKTDWFSPRIPLWCKYKGHFSKEKHPRILEVGAWEGRTTLWMAENFLTAGEGRIDAIDTWAPYPHLKHTEGSYHRFLFNLDKYITARTVIPYREEPSALLPKFLQQFMHNKHDPYDFCFLRFSHDALRVYSDMSLSWKMIKKGGILVVDNYGWQKPALGFTGDKTPKPGIDRFLEDYKEFYILLEKGWQVWLKKNI